MYILDFLSVCTYVSTVYSHQNVCIHIDKQESLFMRVPKHGKKVQPFMKTALRCCQGNPSSFEDAF